MDEVEELAHKFYHDKTGQRMGLNDTRVVEALSKAIEARLENMAPLNRYQIASKNRKNEQQVKFDTGNIKAL